MIDAHVHLEKGSYGSEWIHEFVRYALLLPLPKVGIENPSAATLGFSL